MVAELYQEVLEALLEKYVHPQGISSEDAISSIHEERPDLFERYWRGLRDNELRPYIDVMPHHIEKDIISAFKVLSARHQTRPTVGRPTRDELTAVQCAVLYDRHNGRDPDDGRKRVWTYEKLAKKFGLGTWRTAEDYVQLGRELLDQSFR
jgi:hypothetical protein